MSDDWWTHTRPLFEIHGFFRVRPELFHNFSLGRIDPIVSDQDNAGASVDNPRLFPQPIQNSYVPSTGTKPYEARGCNPGATSAATSTTAVAPSSCQGDKTHASANMRFRIDPEIHISDNLRILSQIDFLDNVVMGSTPEGSVSTPSQPTSNATSGYSLGGRSGYIPSGFFSQSQVAPVSGVNSLQDSVTVKRVWAEFTTPLGQLRFGRMPDHFGLGLVHNAGNGLDSDYQSTMDRIQIISGLKSLDLYFGGSWDFPNSGLTSRNAWEQQGQPYNVSQFTNTSQWNLTLFRKVRPEIAKQRLARGEVVINGGTWTSYRQQLFANESKSNLGTNPYEYRDGFNRYGARMLTPDFWLQVLTKKLRWETELVYVWGEIENPKGIYDSKSETQYSADNYKISQFGGASEFEYSILNDDLKLRFSTGYASGDQNVDQLVPPSGTGAQLQQRLTDNRTISTFRFHPDYRIDLILFRNILNRVQGVYYFRPGVQYDFTKSPDGEKLGGRAEIIYSRMSERVQAPGNQEDLGVELDATLYYQSRDGSLNNDPSKVGGFYAMLQYGVLFPMGGLGYLSKQTSNQTLRPYEVSAAQTIRLFLAASF